MQTSTETPVHKHTITVRWADIDQLKHVNNVTWYRYISEARVSWLESIGALMASDNTSPVVAESGARFLRPATWPDDINIETRVRKVGNSSMTLDYQLFSKREQVLCITGFATIVWTDIDSGKAIQIPDRVRANISQSGPVT